MRYNQLCATLLAVILSVFVSLPPVKGQGQASGKSDGWAPQEKPLPPKASEADSDSRRPVELVSLIDGVRGTFPEFSADMLITIAQSGKVVDTEWKKELLAEAFRAASWAQYPMPQRAVGPYPMDTKYGYLSAAFGLKMDVLSLQCRIVNVMVGLDKTEARKLFSEIDRPRFTPVDCGDGLVYETSDYYETAARLAQQAFSSEEMQEDEHIRFLESLMLDISSPVQLAPMAKVIHSMRLSPPQRERLVGGFASVFRKTKGDDRSFSASVFRVGQEIGKLDYVCGQQQISTGELNKALLEYYVRHYSAERCSDTLRDPGDTTESLPREVRDLNKRLSASDEEKALEIEADEVKPAKILGAVELSIYWQKPPASQIMQSYKRLYFRSGQTVFTRAETETREWRTALYEHLERLSAWEKGGEESEIEFFHQKCLQYETVLFNLYHWPERDDTVLEYLDFLNDFDLRHGSRIEWFWHADKLIRRLELPQDTEARREGIARVMRQLQAAKNPVLYLYSRMRQTLSDGANPESAPAPK